MRTVLDLDKVQPDPLVAARASASCETTILTGRVRSVDKQTIALSLTDQPDPCLKIARSDVVASFGDDSHESITLLVTADADIAMDLKLKASEFSGFGNFSSGCGCGCESSNEMSDMTGVKPPENASQMSMALPGMGLTGRVPWPWCGQACEYCRRYGYACWPCFICQIIASNSLVARS